MKLLLLPIILVLSLSNFAGCKNANIEQNSAYKVVVELESSKGINLDSIKELEFSPINQVGNINQYKSVRGKIFGGKARWEFYVDGVVKIQSPFVFFQLVNPGDSISVKAYDDDLIFSGRGVDKQAIWHQIGKQKQKLTKPTKHSIIINSLIDYFKWNEYADILLALQIPILDSQKYKLQKDEYNYLKSIIIEAAEHDRTNAFMGLISFNNKDTVSPLTGSQLSAIWDSTQNKPWSRWLRSLSTYHGPMDTHYTLNKGSVCRRFNFDFSHDSLHSKEIRTYLYFIEAKNHHEGLTRERLMVHILDEPTIKEIGIKNPITQLLLKDYYSLPGFPEYKAWIKDLENTAK